ncbi:MAG TPA: RagB/SusD family nutrient uptake outer membrane protein, partial [Bacteroidaceae bacterium]|nr:RagB/SusD family nutrient uptake outer membrane protein [Bacteroidaceae bacterium]
YGTASQDPRFDMTYFAGQPLGPDGNPIVMADGETLEYHPAAIKLDLSGDTHEKTAGARMKKYAFDTTAQNDGMKPHNDAVIARYSDVLLMISEAKVRDGQDGTTELNEVRGRVGASTNLPATLENLYAERMRELAWEGWRRNDMIRFGTFTDARNDRPQLTGEANGFTEVFCIPQAVLDLNSKLTQNPGY